MPLQRKSRFGATFLIIGSILAAAGEIVNAQNMDVLGSSWHLSLGLIITGTFILLIGLLPFAAVSEQINGLGFVGCMLILPGGLLLIIGTAALDWIILPFLLNLGNALASAINGPATETQNALNKIIASLNGLGSSVLQKLFPTSTPHISAIHILKANGVALVNKVLVQLHLPTIERLTWWGHFSLSGGTLSVGSLILGIALLRRMEKLSFPGVLLIIFALLNLLCQFDTALHPFLGNITAVVLFLTLAWLGISEWLVKYTNASISEGMEK
jgi:hypothetical protein